MRAFARRRRVTRRPIGRRFLARGVWVRRAPHSSRRADGRIKARRSRKLAAVYPARRTGFSSLRCPNAPCTFALNGKLPTRGEPRLARLTSATQANKRQRNGTQPQIQQAPFLLPHLNGLIQL